MKVSGFGQRLMYKWEVGNSAWPLAEVRAFWTLLRVWFIGIRVEDSVSYLS